MKASDLKPGMWVKHSGVVCRIKAVWADGIFTHADVFGGGRISFITTDKVTAS